MFQSTSILKSTMVIVWTIALILCAIRINLIDSIAVQTDSPVIEAAVRETSQRDNHQQQQQQHVLVVNNENHGSLIDNGVEHNIQGDGDGDGDGDDDPTPDSDVGSILPQHPFPPIPGPVKVRQCEPIHIDLCYGLGYNVTGFPNLAGHESATDAEQQLRTFSPLIKYECSSNGELRLFLCAVYVPMCTEQFPEVIGPCRSVCERVRKSCEPVLQHFGFPWPPALRCDHFHARNNVDDHMCMEGPEGSEGDPHNGNVDARTPSPGSGGDKAVVPVVRGCANDNAARCPEHAAVNDISGNTTEASSSSSELIYVWTAVWSVSATLSTLFVIVTFTIDSSRYSYADKIVLLAATCSAVCAVSHLSRLAFADGGSALISSSGPTGEVAQQQQQQQHLCKESSDVRERRLLTPRGEPGSDCTVAFVVVYYFSLAASLWWLVLTIVLVLKAGENTRRGALQRRWTDADIRRQLSTWFHLISWSIPAVATIILLVRKEIVVDPTSIEAGARPVCRVLVGSVSGLGLVLAPMSICLTFGVCMLFVSAIRFRKRRTCQTDAKDANSYQHHHNDAKFSVGKNDELLKNVKQSCKQKSQKLTINRAVLNELQLTTERNATSGGVSDENHDDDDVAGTVRVGVIGVIVAVALVGAVSSLVFEYVQQSSSVAAVLVNVLSSVLVAFVVGPWLVMSGQASASWNGFLQRRRDRKGLLQTTSTSSCGRPQCVQCATTCKSISELNASSNCQRPSATTRLPVTGEGCRQCRQNPFTLAVDPSTSSRGCNEFQTRSKTRRPTAAGVPLLSTVHDGACDNGGGQSQHASCHERCLGQMRQQRQMTVGRSSTASHCTSSAMVSGGPWPVGSSPSVVAGLDMVSCKFCRRQHRQRFI